ncbi:hypothetical protein FRB95_006223 [Tulasnella sp. JGI-2019a]|nr:hypothetical protein FRB95_006223 [Tulasnella sp. JGI-2019a]
MVSNSAPQSSFVTDDVLSVFLLPCLTAMRQLFPKIENKLEYFGIGALPNTLEGYYGSVCLVKPYKATDVDCPKILPITCSLFETLVRRPVFTCRANVTFLQGTVDKFERSKEDSTKLSGVSVKTPQGDRFEKVSFIIDSTGVAQLSYNKLSKSAGFSSALPARIEYEPHLNYSQVLFTVICLIGPLARTGPATFSFYDNNMLCIAVGSWGDNEKPHTIPEMRLTIKSIHGADSTPDFIWQTLDFLEEHEDDCPCWIYDANAGKMSNILYHKGSEALPSNWVAIGDAVTKLNPIYGQGTTKAVIDVVTLDSIFRATPASQGLAPDLPKKFFVKRAPRVLGLWEGTKAPDYSYATTQPAKGKTNAAGTYARNLGLTTNKAGREDLHLAKVFYHVQSRVAPPTDLLSPVLVAKVVKKWIMG